MHRIIWYKLGEARLHLLKLAGAFLLLTSILKVFEASYLVFVTVSKAIAAQTHPEMIATLFGWAIGATANPTAPGVFMFEDVLGVLLGPFANFFFWLGVAVLAIMLYQAGKVAFPIEEWEAPAHVEHRESLLAHFAEHRHKFAKKKKR